MTAPLIPTPAPDGIPHTVSVTVTERYEIAISEDVLADIVRRAVGAPDNATVDTERFEGATVSWLVSREETR